MSRTVRQETPPSEVDRTASPGRHGRSVGAEPCGALSKREVAQPPRALADAWTAWRARKCPHAEAELVGHYMKHHVRPIAERLRASLPGHVEVDDLLQQGFLGLKEAMGRFDPEQGVKFETFSSRRIVGAMQDWLRSLDHVPRLMRRRARIVQKQTDRFQARYGRMPDQEELRAGLEVTDAEFGRIVGEAAPPVVVTISTASGDDDDAMTVPARHAPSPGRTAQRRDLRQWITRDLDTIDRMIVSLYYYESLTMREIGIAIGCSESRVSQRLDSILHRLRGRLDLKPEHLTLAG
ncbi:MAG: sigma-70 family RNA polymerase sigma factor [Phycisphaerales bacterium]|nr:sigma-70 family RNA polymerase sigma factor [Phycisphaerales bacterium]